MSDEAIKKALECCVEGHCSKCPMLGKYSCSKSLREHALDLINRQQERIEELEIITGLANSRKYYRKFVDEVFCKQKGNELSEPDFDYIYQLYFEQQAEIERLKSLCTSKDVIIKEQEVKIERYEKESNAEFDKWKLLDDRTRKRYAELFEEAKEFVRTEAIKEFAEKLKERQRTFIGDEYAYEFIPSIEIDVLLVEMAGGENA